LFDALKTLAIAEVKRRYPATTIGQVKEAKEHFFAVCIELGVKFRLVSTVMYATRQSLLGH